MAARFSVRVVHRRDGDVLLNPVPDLTRTVSLRVNLQYASEINSGPSESILRWWIREVIRTIGVKDAELTVRLVGEAEAAALNKRYRHKLGPTNVLSFPMILPDAVGSSYLGDLVICVPVVTREANEQGKTLEAHFAHMLIHGVLHLLGYDHQGRSEAREMENLERQVLSQLGYSDPYPGE